MADQYYIEQGYYTPDGYFVYIADAQLTASSSGTLTALGGRQADAASTLTATATVSCDALRLGAPIEANASLSAAASITIDVAKTVDVSSTQSAEFTLSGSAGRILEGQGAFTGAFTPTLTVEAIKNHTAILDAVFTVTTVGVANRATSIAVDTIAALNAQAAKTVDVQSNQTSTATATINGNSQRTASATLTSTATLVCEAFNVQFGQINLTATSSIYASRYFGSKRPRNLSVIDGGFSNSLYKFGSYGLIGRYQLPSIVGSVSDLAIGTIPKDTEGFVFETWFYKNSTTTRTIISWNAIEPVENAFFNLVHLTNGTIRLEMFIGASGSFTITNSAVSNAAWHHLLVVKDSNAVSFYVNGSRAGTFQWASGFYWRAWNNPSPSMIIDARNHAVDETSLHIGTTLGYSSSSTSITVPTQGRTNDPATTAFLYHFENDANDDISVTQTGAASLTANATITAQGREIAVGSASLTGQSTLSAIGSLLNVAQASITSTASLSATIGTVESAEASVTAQASVTAVAVKTTDIASTQSSQASQSTDFTRTRDFTVSLTGAFTPTLTVDVLKNHTAVLDAVTTLTAQISAVQTASASITATSTVSADIAVTRTVNIDVATTTAQSVSADRIRTTATNWLAEFQFSAQAGQEQEAAASITATASLTADVARTRDLASTQFSVSSLQLTEANVFRNLGDQTFTATASVSASVTNRIGFTVALTSTASVTAVAVKTTGITSTQQVQFTQSASAAKTVNPPTAFSSIATQLTSIGYNATGTILLESTASLTAIIGSIKQYVGSSISGVKAEASTKRYAKLASGASLYNESGITMAIWARRDDLNPSTSQFWSTDLLGFSLVRFGFVNQTTARFSVSGSGFVENWNWNNSVPYDNLWHHYIVRIKRTGVGLTNGFDEIELWVDGEYKGLRTNSQGFNIYNWSVFGPINLGRGPKHPSEASGPYYFDGDLAQIWIGDINNFVLSSLWNNGPIDLGPTGTNDGFLPTPSIYSSIDTPYTNITFWEDNDPVSALGADQPLDLPDMTVKASLSAGILGVFLYGANLTATTAMTCSAVKTTGAVSTQSAVATINIDPVKSTGIISNQSAEFSIDADVNLGPAGGAALFDHASTLTAQAGYLRDQSSTQSAQATMTTTAMVIPPVSGDALLTVFVSQTTTAGYLISAQSSKGAVCTMTAEGTVIDPVRASGTLSVDTALTCEITRVRPGISLEASMGTLSCDVTVIPPIRAEANLTVTVTMTVAVSGVYQGITLVASAGTMTVTPVYTAGASSQITGQFTQQTIPGTRIGIVAVLSAQGFQLTVGDVINIDPYLTLRIRPESRTLTIEAETRTIRIRPESRQLTIEGYSQ